MSQTSRAAARPGLVPAFLTAAGVFVVLVVIGLVQALLSTLSLVVSASAGQGFVGSLWTAQLVNSLTGPLPFAVGAFLSFWLVAPIAPVLRFAHVVTRSILAALLGGAVMWIVFLVGQVVVDISDAPFSFHASDVFGRLGPDALEAVFRALAVVAGYLPLAVLAAILLWGWRQRHPLGEPAGGTLDEV